MANALAVTTWMIAITLQGKVLATVLQEQTRLFVLAMQTTCFRNKH